ncbi:uncharacterized protein [Cicer arietinum]|uniref:uncharacterized protein n=1 Tax=Cicer arietinum TaxID=3827 RepID=UPI003CC67A9A
MRLHMFEQSCVDCKVFVDYVKETWVESAHWKLKLMLESSMGDMCKCWEAMNNMIREAQRRIAEEYDKVEWVGTDKSVCGYSIRRTYELPCACELGQYKLLGAPNPLDSVHIQWRKLSMECELAQDTEDGSELDMSTEMNALWKRVLKSKVRELAFPSTSSICPPPDKSSKKRQTSQLKKQPSQSSQSSKQLFLTQFSNVIQSYIDDIFDVTVDGNCGFRAIALLLGHGEECWSLVCNRLDHEIASHVTPYDRLFTGCIREVRDSVEDIRLRSSTHG